MAAVQPHPLTPASSTLPIYLFFLCVTCEQKAKYCPELPSTPIPSLICSSTSIPPFSTNPLAMAQNSPFPMPTSAPYRLSYTPGSLCRCTPRPDIFAVCVSQMDGQFPFLALFSRHWNIDKLHIERPLFGNTRMGMESPSCSGQYYAFRFLRAGVNPQCDRT